MQKLGITYNTIKYNYQAARASHKTMEQTHCAIWREQGYIGPESALGIAYKTGMAIIGRLTAKEPPLGQSQMEWNGASDYSLMNLNNRFKLISKT